MPNPRITFRVTPELLEQLPTDADERSEFVVAAIQQKLHPAAPDGEIGELLARMEILEAIAQEFINERDKPKKQTKQPPTDLDQAINQTLLRLRPSERRDAAKLFNRLRSAHSADVS